MAKLYNLAGMSTATVGTGTITLGSAMYGHLTFALAGVADGETVTYAIKDGAASEIGRGVYTSSGTTLTRTVLKSTNSNSAISLSGAAEVFITPAAEDIIPRLSSTVDNTVPRHDGTAGLLQSSGVAIDDSNNVTGAATISATTVNASSALHVGSTVSFGSEKSLIYGSANSSVHSLVRNDDAGSAAYAGCWLNAYGNSWAFRVGSAAANSNKFVFTSDILGVATNQMELSTAGALRLNAYGAGTLSTDSSGNITASSDEALKEGIAPFTRGLSDILGINTISYNWNALSGLDRMNRYYGFSAQNVEAAIPEAIGIGADGYLTLQERPILAALVNAVKELGSVTQFEAGGYAFSAGRAEKDRAALLITASQTAVIQGAQAGDYRWFDAAADFEIADANGVPVKMDAIAAFAYCNAMLKAII